MPSAIAITPIAITPPALLEKLPEAHGPASRDKGPWRPALAHEPSTHSAEAVEQRLRRQLVSAPPMVLERPSRPPAYTSQFLAQVIAQEIMPRDVRDEPNFLADGLAAYLAAAARTETVLGPAESLSLLA